MTLSTNSRKRKRDYTHPYLAGNFAPVQQTHPLTPCSYSGSIPDELFGGEYVRNGGNPVSNEDLGRDAHWFDGDGMLSGVAFTRKEDGVQPEFVNQYILTDLYLSTLASPFLQRPIMPSIATFVDPLCSLYAIILHVLRTLCLVALSHLPGSTQAIKKTSVANTGVLFHDGRALATCESGPPMRISLPGLETIGWYNGKRAEGESGGEPGPGFGGEGIFSSLKEYTTAHPRVDPKSEELILFHSAFVPPYVHYSILPSTHPPAIPNTPLETPTRLLNSPIPGISAAKMMHDFGVSFRHTVIMDLPLSLDPLNLAKNKPIVSYDSKARSRFGVFPRYDPKRIRWFETDACCIFHTANTWDDAFVDKASGSLKTTAVNMLACRLTSASLVFATGDIAVPEPTPSSVGEEEEQCRLYYYQFCMDEQKPGNDITYQFALSAITFEFPSTREDAAMAQAKYVYGCTSSEGAFRPSLGRSAKINCLAKIDVETLINRGKKDSNLTSVTGCVDRRSEEEILASTDPHDPIQIFRLPPNHFAQEPRFVPKSNSATEDDGWILSYVFDESQLDKNGECPPDSKSDLWIIDATDMKTVVAKIHLPARVPYGLHGQFIGGEQILNQRPVETIRGIRELQETQDGMWIGVRRRIEKFLG